MKQESVDKIITEIFKVREILGNDLTDLGSKTTTAANDSQKFIEKLRKALSSLAGAITTAVNESEVSDNLSDADKNILEQIRKFASTLGDMQYRLNELNKKYDSFIKLAEELSQSGFVLLDEVMNVQADAVNISKILKMEGYKLPLNEMQKMIGDSLEHNVDENK